MMSKILPEACYEFKPLTIEDVLEAYKTNTTITGLVVKVRSDALIVKLGEELFGTLPFEETTIYPFTYSTNKKKPLPLQIYTILKKQIRIKVTSINFSTDSEDNIVLSRKANMIEAVERLSKREYVLFKVTSLTPSLVFGDCGDGICGRITISEVTKSRIQNVAEYFHVNDELIVKILNMDELNRFNLSYKERFPEYNPKQFMVGDSYVATVPAPVDQAHSGYFVCINPQVTGIMDADTSMRFQYGERVVCRVKRVCNKGLKLTFVNKYQ